MRNQLHLLGLAGAIALASPAVAAEPSAHQPGAARPAATAPASSSRLVGVEALKGARGGTAITVTNQTLAAITSGNTLGDYTAGNVSLSDNALSNFAGVGNLLINTGAQNSLQTGMTLVINVTP